MHSNLNRSSRAQLVRWESDLTGTLETQVDMETNCSSQEATVPPRVTKPSTPRITAQRLPFKLVDDCIFPPHCLIPPAVLQYQTRPRPAGGRLARGLAVTSTQTLMKKLNKSRRTLDRARRPNAYVIMRHTRKGALYHAAHKYRRSAPRLNNMIRARGAEQKQKRRFGVGGQVSKKAFRQVERYVDM